MPDPGRPHPARTWSQPHSSPPCLHGVEDELPLPDPQVGDADAAPNTDRHAPHSLAEALDAVEKDSVLTEALGADLVRTFVGIKRTEVNRFNAAVTDWEIREYARLF